MAKANSTQASRAASSAKLQKALLVPESTDETREIPFFSRWRQGKNDTVKHWDVVATGRWQEDCAIGRYYADEYIRYLEQDNGRLGDQGLLYQIATDMDKGDHTKGVRVGFWGRVGELLEEVAQRRVNSEVRNA